MSRNKNARAESDDVTYELTPALVQRLLHDATILAAAVTIYVPATEARPHRSARRVLRELMPSTMAPIKAVAAPK